MKSFLIPLSLAIAFSVQADVVKIQLPVETAVYKASPGSQLANAQCLTCHSADYSTMQPSKPRDFWKGAVEKMKAKYGAPIPDDQMEGLITYFAQNYGTEVATNSTPVATQTPAHTTVDVQQLATKSGCLNCHNAQVKIIGPAYKDVAAKYAGKADGLTKVVHQITHGGSGQWGSMPMPPYDQFSESELKALGEWVLSQK